MTGPAALQAERLRALEAVMHELVEAYGEQDMPTLVLDTLARLNSEWRAGADVGVAA